MANINAALMPAPYLQFSGANGVWRQVAKVAGRHQRGGNRRRDIVTRIAGKLNIRAPG